MKSIINTELLSVKEYESFVASPYPNSDFSIGRNVNSKTVVQNLAENLLLYDQVKIVTKSFEEVITLKNWIGPSLLNQLLHDGVLKFIQTPFTWCYIQKEKFDKGAFSLHGIATVSLADEAKTRFKEQSGSGDLDLNVLGGWSSPDLEKAVHYTLVKFHQYNPKKIGKFSRLIARNTTQLNSDDFRRFITNKSEEDLKDKDVRSLVGLPEDIDTENIPDNSKEIRQLFKIILANQNLAIMQTDSDSDILTEKFYSDSLDSPLQKELSRMKNKKKVNKVFKMERLPTPKELGNPRIFSLPEIIKLRSSREGENFRGWIHKHFDNSEDIEAAYLDLFKKSNTPFVYRLISTVAQPLLSLGASAATGIPSIITDYAVGGVTEFKVNSLAERYFNRNSPKMFAEKVRKNIK